MPSRWRAGWPTFRDEADAERRCALVRGRGGGKSDWRSRVLQPAKGLSNFAVPNTWQMERRYTKKWRATGGLLQKPENRLRHGIGLRKHRGTRLDENVI